jgi:hypothetical protein
MKTALRGRACSGSGRRKRGRRLRRNRRSSPALLCWFLCRHQLGPRRRQPFGNPAPRIRKSHIFQGRRPDVRWGARIRTWEWRNRFVRRRDRALQISRSPASPRRCPIHGPSTRAALGSRNKSLPRPGASRSIRAGRKHSGSTMSACREARPPLQK